MEAMSSWDIGNSIDEEYEENDLENVASGNSPSSLAEAEG